MGIFSDNFYSWLAREHAAEKVAMDSTPFKEEEHPRAKKGDEEGGKFIKKPETLAKEDDRDNVSSSRAPQLPPTESNSHKPHYRALRDAQAKQVNGMGTFDLMTGAPITGRTSGYQVSFQEATTESPGHGSYISDDEYDRKVEAIGKELGARPELGHWDEDEISFHCESLDKALEVARRHNQEAIWNWSKGEPMFNPDFVGRLHYTDRDNHATKRYHAHKPISGKPQGTK